MPNYQLQNGGGFYDVANTACYFKFNGSANDDSTNARNLTLNNSPTYVDGFFSSSGALQFASASSQYADYSGNIVTAEPLFVSCWVKPTVTPTTGQYKTIWSINCADVKLGWEMCYCSPSGTPQIQTVRHKWGSTDVTSTITYTLPLGRWTHMVMRCNTSSVYGIIDGHYPVGNAAVSGTGTTTTYSALTIGAARDAAGNVKNYFDGAVDDFLAINRTINDPAQALEYFSRNRVRYGERTPPGRTFTAYYRMGHDTGAANQNCRDYAANAAENLAAQVNGPTFEVGHLDRVNGFNGSNQSFYSLSGAWVAGTQIVMSLWARATTQLTTAGKRTLISSEEATKKTRCSIWYLHDGTNPYIRFQRERGGDTTDAVNYQVQLDTTKFHHFGFVYNTTANSITGYYDGKNVGSVNRTGDGTTQNQNAGWIGTNRQAPIYYWTGKIDELIVDTRAWSDGDMRRYYGMVKGHACPRMF